MATLSREDARVLVGKIREDNGGISAEDRAACPPAVLRALENVRRKLGAATKTLATNLYSRDTRFVYELIQNAEDNRYTRAEAEGINLYLSFSMYPDRIVLESNEDGFCEEHVRAICSTGESTKTVAQGYIGEKGIGFKSVFKVAKKVHIQSGPFSFSFEHTRDSSDDGLGMVTPLDEDYDELPAGVHTRITLTLLDSSKFEQRVQDLLNVPDTLLLFLTKLDTLHINIYPQHESATETEYSHSGYKDDGLETITKITTVDGVSTQETQDFYVIRKEINDLPHDEARRNTTQATVVLAFPVEEDEPVIRQQHVFAFLPLRLAGFTFLIQSDFVTQASREDVFHSARNKSLLSGVAETFRSAVLRFCDHPSLQYKWMRYLPSDSISDEFWKNLRPEIIALLSKTHCLRSWSGASLHLPHQLYRLRSGIRDRYDEPLFADLAEEAYLSRKYTKRDFESLIPLGAQVMNVPLWIARIRSDLGRSDSKMKAITTEEDWHTRNAKLLSQTFMKASNKANRGIIEALKSLDLIPLQDYRWVSGRTTPIFLPTTGGIPIPTDLGLDLVQPAAISNADRKILFLHLGVTEAIASYVTSHISRTYRVSSLRTMSENISHLQYLYWNLPQDVPALDQSIFLMDQNGDRVYRTTSRIEYIYFEEEQEEYGPCQLLQSVPLANPDAPGLSVHFLNAAYLGAVDTAAVHHGRSWKLWLTEFAGVQSYPQLQDPNSLMLSDEFEYIMEHRPEKLIGLLKRYWNFYEPQMIPAIVRELREWRVPSKAHLALNLEDTFLPLPRLKAIIRRLKIVDFPFLIMPEELTDEDENEWQFLKIFGVRFSGGNDDLHFYVKALSRIAVENADQLTRGSMETLFQVYGAIERHCSSSDDVDYLCEYFDDFDLIYIPSSAEHDAKWVNPRACVWTAPEWLEAKSRLDGVSKFADYRHLFHVVLKIGDANWRDYLEDLEALKQQNRGNIERVVNIYRCLWREFERDSSWEMIRTSFEESELVFWPSQNTWHPLSSCVWADDQVQIPRRASIRTPYANLEDFFCRVLDVPKPNLKMHVQALKELARSRLGPSASEVKQAMMLISSMDPTVDDVRELRRANIFSVITTNGQKTFTDTTADFAIVDRSEYGSAFAAKIRILDYSIEEVRSCRSLLLALDLKRRHLSELVEETTTVQDGAINTALTQNFRLRAYALFRCAVHYHSQKSRDGDTSLYKHLLGASVYVSDGIYKSISVVQYGETVTVKEKRANFHLEGDDDELRLYIPRDEIAREECFFRQLPRRLMTYLAISDPTAEALLSGVIGCRSLIAIDGILKDAGIVEINGIERPSQLDQMSHQSDSENTSNGDNTAASTDGHTSQFSHSTSVSITEVIHTARDEVDRSPVVRRNSPRPHHQRSTPSSRPVSPANESTFPIPSVDNRIRDTGYAALLERVINSARIMTIPLCGNHSVDHVQDVNPLGVTLFDSTLTTRSVERDRKVGAAGELLVFEILLNLGLFGFTTDNWKSTIRREVRVHDKYRNLEPWLGRETADIVYDDSEGNLTELLIEQGYLQSETWEDERPKYDLEVKTTTKDFREQFYMSGSQYDRMKRMHLPPQGATSKVYVILRVFNLEGRIGLRVYVDPESSRLDGELDFNIDTWAVKPVGNIPR